jgi:hypothetical protein
MISRDRSVQAADALRLLPHHNSDDRVLLQVLGMETLGSSDFCDSLTAANDALIISELKPAPDLPHAARVSMCRQAMTSLASLMPQR